MNSLKSCAPPLPTWRETKKHRFAEHQASGSGGGIDVLLSARRVGPTGKAYGLDMTHEMLSLAEENKRVYPTWSS
jgi:hypothetical protein